MNFEFAKELDKLIIKKKIEEAIEIAEEKLETIPQSAFHKILARGFAYQADNLVCFIEDFYVSVKEELKIKSFYVEMNGFTINPDLWYVDVFALDRKGSIDNLEWMNLKREYSTVQNEFILKGLEQVQTAFGVYMKNEGWKNKPQESAMEICELLVILRLHELFQVVYEKAKGQKKEWAKIPFFITAHDYDLIYQSRK